jgi:hypothetical protein
MDEHGQAGYVFPQLKQNHYTATHDRFTETEPIQVVIS